MTTYDGLNRLSQKGYPDSTAADYVYDLAGRLKQVTYPNGIYGFAYDNMGRLLGTSTKYSLLPGQTYTNAYAYDAASNRTSFTAPDGSAVTYNYDTLKRLNTLNSSSAGQFTFGYDALSRRSSLVRPNGVNTSYAYDALSRLLSVTHQAGGTTVDGAGYAYDNAGNRIGKGNFLDGSMEQYTYDPIYQLTQVNRNDAVSESYSYDAVGNRLSALTVPSLTYNSSNELLSTSKASYIYDNNGNTTSKTNASGTTTYTWDFENRLASVTLPGSGGTVTFKYDPFGRRIQKSGPAGTTNYLYDGASAITDLDAIGAVLARYTQGSGIDEPLASVTGAGTAFFEADGLGSITSLSGPSGLTDTYTYKPFGITTATGTNPNRFRYTGREWDQETGLYYYRARYYDPQIGRLLSEDPIGFVGNGANFYQYVGNSPPNFNDPFGLTNCVVTPLGTVCSDWNTDWSWMEPQPPGPPPIPDELKPPLVWPCGCDKIKEIEVESTKKKWEEILAFIGTTSATPAAEPLIGKWGKRLVPIVEVFDMVHLEYALFKIELDKEKEIRKVHEECGDVVFVY